MASTHQLWLSPPANLTLPNSEVHVWRAALDQPASHVRNLAQILSSDERNRAQRFHFERHKRRFTVGRGVLRTILGWYLDIEPRQLEFSYGPQGKPYLAKQFGEPALQFNLSHSHELALFAFTLGREIGVDLEFIRPMPDLEEVATRFFSTNENAVLNRIPVRQKVEAFFTCWTRKEAYIKARGEGLSMPLNEFDVSLSPGEPAALLNVRINPQEVNRWSLQALDPAPGYIGALIVEGQAWDLSCWQWSV